MATGQHGSEEAPARKDGHSQWGPCWYRSPGCSRALNSGGHWPEIPACSSGNNRLVDITAFSALHFTLSIWRCPFYSAVISWSLLRYGYCQFGHSSEFASITSVFARSFTFGL